MAAEPNKFHDTSLILKGRDQTFASFLVDHFDRNDLSHELYIRCGTLKLAYLVVLCPVNITVREKVQ